MCSVCSGSPGCLRMVMVRLPGLRGYKIANCKDCLFFESPEMQAHATLGTSRDIDTTLETLSSVWKCS